MCTVLNYYFLSVFTEEDVDNVPIPQQMFQRIENDKVTTRYYNKNGYGAKKREDNNK